MLQEGWNPRRSDSHLAAVKPEPPFLEFFRQSLVYTSNYCTDADCCNFFEAAPINHQSPSHPPIDITGSHPEIEPDTELNYPLSLFEELRDLPSIAVLYGLAQRFHSQFLSSVPFLAKISCLAPNQKETPSYLLLSQALLGAAVSRDRQSQAFINTLWRASTALITGTVEVDNSLGTTIPWHIAVRPLHCTQFST